MHLLDSIIIAFSPWYHINELYSFVNINHLNIIQWSYYVLLTGLLNKLTAVLQRIRASLMKLPVGCGELLVMLENGFLAEQSIS